MPALFPTFQLAAYFGNEATIAPGGELLEQYSISGAGGYGYYDGTGMVINPPYYPDVFQHDQIEWVIPANAWETGGPRTIICTQDLGDTQTIVLYGYADYTGRATNDGAFSLAKVGTNYGTSDTLVAAQSEGTDEFSVAVFDYRQPVQNLFLFGETTSPATGVFDVIDHGIKYFEELALTRDAALLFDAPDAVYGEPEAFTIALAQPVPTKDLAIWIGNVGWTTGRRTVITGVKINNILYGVDDKGNDGAEANPFAEAEDEGGWWTDVQSCTQSGTASQGAYSGAFVDGYNEGYYEISKGYSFANFGNVTGWSVYLNLSVQRDSFSVGATRGLFDATDEGGSPYNLPEPALFAEQKARPFALKDSYFDALRAGLISAPEMVASADGGRSYAEPTRYVENSTYGVSFIANYNGYYNGSYDACVEANAGVPTYDAATGQTGDAIYNAAYKAGYDYAWVDFGNTIPPPDYTALGFYAAYAIAFDNIEDDIPELPNDVGAPTSWDNYWTPYYATYYDFDDRYSNQDSPIVGEFGAWFGWDDKIDQEASPPVTGYTPQDAVRAAAYGLKFGMEDARFDLGQSPASYGKTYANPATYTGLNDATAFALVAAQAYNGAYNGWTDGYNDDQASNPNDPTGGYTGNSDYNTAYNTAYLNAYPGGG